MYTHNICFIKNILSGTSRTRLIDLSQSQNMSAMSYFAGFQNPDQWGWGGMQQQQQQQWNEPPPPGWGMQPPPQEMPNKVTRSIL